MKMIGEQHEEEAHTALIELQALRLRFAACIATLTARWFSGTRLPELSSWAEVEQLLNETEDTSQ